MANEAILRYRKSNPEDYIISDTNGVEKGTLMALTDPRTCVAASSTGQRIAGILAREKIASDGRTRAPLYRDGTFDMRCSGTVVLGSKVCAMGHENYIRQAVSGDSGTAVLGVALETGTGGEVIQVELNIGAGDVG
jgi:hypothetical protein